MWDTALRMRAVVTILSRLVIGDASFARCVVVASCDSAYLLP